MDEKCAQVSKLPLPRNAQELKNMICDNVS